MEQLQELLGPDYTVTLEYVAKHQGRRICLGNTSWRATKTVELMKLVGSFGRVEFTEDGWLITCLKGYTHLQPSIDFDKVVKAFTEYALAELDWHDLGHGIKATTNGTHGMVYRSGRINTHLL